MNNWAPPFIAAALFWLLSPGMIFQLPGKNSPFEFMNMKTTVASIFVHTVIYEEEAAEDEEEKEKEF
ncbi:hypothetical protein Ahy_B06g084728 isoform B [Arachis hypogaea]|uniref:Uncharacterized protein n=1 Tax=Arachis hypogaea TaxID=3818 RepID=A0A444YSN2_ARAHY|nr:hypothetical protein Ahy_B06g084728 isoform A [Arachis hypogaea]RYR04918.1 hypothetical protein Ahy_B06g084728 isoform B [Arachis hypogaea]